MIRRAHLQAHIADVVLQLRVVALKEVDSFVVLCFRVNMVIDVILEDRRRKVQ